MDRADSGNTQGGWQVICLCAAWCGACREWRAAFEEAAAAHPQLHFAWVDIEDEADALGEVDIETFPTVLIAQGGRARFYGPVLPSAAQLARLITSLQDSAEGSVAAEATPLLQRLNTLVLPAL